MLSFLLALQITATPLATFLPVMAATDAALLAVPPLAIADRPRGAIVADPAGAPLGVIEDAEPAATTLRVGNYKVRLPANALRRTGGRLATSVTAAQVAALMTAAAAYQRQAHPALAAVQPPRGFVTPSQAAAPAVPAALLNNRSTFTPPPAALTAAMAAEPK